MATIAKIIKNKSGFMLALLLIFFVSAGAIKARTVTDDKKEKAPAEKKKGSAIKKHKVTTYYQFNGDATNITSPGQYSAVSTPPTGCSGSNLPCYLTVVDQTLEAWLSGKSAEDVVQNASATKN